MATTTALDVALPQEVANFLSSKSAESEYQTTLEVVQEAFVGLAGISVYLQDDPDEEGVQSVIVDVRLPATFPLREYSDRLRQYSRLLRDRLPNIAWPVCSLSVSFG